MTTTAAKPGFDAETDRLLAGLGVARDRYTGGTLKARSPIDGVHAGPPAGDSRRTQVGAGIAAPRRRSKPGATCRRRGAASWCGCSARSCARPRTRSAGW